MIEVKWAYSWHQKQDIRILYPNGVPRFVISGILAFGAGVDCAVQERIEANKNK